MRLIDADTLKEHKFVSIDCYLKSNCDNGFPQYKQGWNDAIDTIIDNAPTADDWQKYSDELWKNAYERGKADAYEKAKQKVTVSVKVVNETVETIEINGDAVRWSSSSL